MRIRFYNARILTMKDENIIEGELWTNDSVIEYVGQTKDSIGVFDREIDCKGNLLMPGLKNAHTHSAMTFARSLADDYSLNDWLFKAIFPIEGKLVPDHIYWFNKLAYAEYLQGGCTAGFDMYFYCDSGAKAAVESGFRQAFCGSVNDFGGFDRLEDEYERFNNYNPLISYQLGFHAEYTTSEDLMKKISDVAHKYEAPIYAHISETKAEVEGCFERYNMSPVQKLNELGMFDFGGGGFHCVWFDEKDREIFKNKGLYAVLNSCSNLKLASGIAPVSTYIKDGIKLGIGTDGAGSNNSLNMFREMYLASVLSNVTTNTAAAVKPFDILKAATSGSALAMGLSDCDVLDVNKQADIIMLDMSMPNMNPINNIVANIVYSGDVNNVIMTMIAGNILYENGQLLTIDLETVNKECNKLINELRS